MHHRTRAALLVAVACAALAGCFDRVGVTCASLRPLCEEDDLSMAGSDFGGLPPDLDFTTDGERPKDLAHAADLAPPPDFAPLPDDLVTRKDISLDVDAALDLAVPADLRTPPDGPPRNDLMTPADMVPCSNNSCPNGCCSNGVCVQPTPLLCGVKGVVCVKCAGGQLCVLGICI